MIVTVKGKVFTGLGEGRMFTELPWVKRRIKERLGFDPYVGTLNLSISLDRQIGNLIKRAKGWEIPPERGCFSGRFYRALVNGRVPGAVVRPETPDYPEGVLEIVAPFSLREKFHLRDDDEVEVEIWLE